MIPSSDQRKSEKGEGTPHCAVRLQSSTIAWSAARHLNACAAQLDGKCNTFASHRTVGQS